MEAALGGICEECQVLPVDLAKEGKPVKARLPVAMVLLAGVVLLVVPGSGAGQPRAMVPPETEAERIARETVAAVRASEQGTRTSSLAPLAPSQRQKSPG